MIVAVTGGTGFIGRHLIARHLARGDQVRYLTRMRPAKEMAGTTAIIGNLNSSAEALKEFVRGADVLFHCAAELRNDAEMHSTNVSGTANLIAAAAGEIGRWVQLSSTGAYGRALSGDVDECSPDRPAGPYENSKVAADELLRHAARNRDFPCVILRPSNVYGTDMPNQSLFQLIHAVERGLFFFIGKPGAVANYVHVENVVDALVLCATRELRDHGRTYIVSDHLMLEEFVGVVATTLSRNPPRLRLPATFVRALSMAGNVIPGFPLSPSRVAALTGRHIFRTDRISSELGYENRISMGAGMTELARFWKQQRIHA